MVAISPFVASKLTVSSNEREKLLLKITALITKTQRKQADFKLKITRTNRICPCYFFLLIYSSTCS